MTDLHPSDPRISEFSAAICKGDRTPETIVRRLFAWFDRHVVYSRLQAPFFPLQRSDLDVLAMQAGTCGDFSNLLVSVLLANGFDAQYAYVHRDCYGDSQDHICAAVKENGRWVLLDATQPYRKWHGFDCPHRSFDLLSPSEFARMIKQEEAYWRAAAERRGRPLLAGLFYAPWIHAECVLNTDACYEEVFYLLSLNDPLAPVLYVYDKRYTPQQSALPLMAAVSSGKTLFHVSTRPRSDLWDPAQWSEGMEEAALPPACCPKERLRMRRSMSSVLPQINRILLRAGCGTLTES